MYLLLWGRDPSEAVHTVPGLTLEPAELPGQEEKRAEDLRAGSMASADVTMPH